MQRETWKISCRCSRGDARDRPTTRRGEPDGRKPRLSLKMGRLRRETCVDAAKFNFLRRKLGEGAFSARDVMDFSFPGDENENDNDDDDDDDDDDDEASRLHANASL